MDDKQVVKLNINGQEIVFNVDDAAHEKLIDEMQPNKKVVPMHNFLVRVVQPESKDALTPLLKKPGAVMEIAAKLLEEFSPELSIKLGE